MLLSSRSVELRYNEVLRAVMPAHAAYIVVTETTMETTIIRRYQACRGQECEWLHFSLPMEGFSEIEACGYNVFPWLTPISDASASDLAARLRAAGLPTSTYLPTA